MSTEFPRLAFTSITAPILKVPVSVPPDQRIWDIDPVHTPPPDARHVEVHVRRLSLHSVSMPPVPTAWCAQTRTLYVDVPVGYRNRARRELEELADAFDRGAIEYI